MGSGVEKVRPRILATHIPESHVLFPHRTQDRDKALGTRLPSSQVPVSLLVTAFFIAMEEKKRFI